MADRLAIDVFCEDSGHETFLRNLIKDLASSVAVSTPELRFHSARGGHGSGSRGPSTPWRCLVGDDRRQQHRMAAHAEADSGCC